MYYHHITFFFFNDTATTEIYTLSLHDALPIWVQLTLPVIKKLCEGAASLAICTRESGEAACRSLSVGSARRGDRKSTRLNSSHGYISYAVFCLKKKKKKEKKSRLTNTSARQAL